MLTSPLLEEPPQPIAWHERIKEPVQYFFIVGGIYAAPMIASTPIKAASIALSIYNTAVTIIQKGFSAEKRSWKQLIGGMALCSLSSAFAISSDNLIQNAAITILGALGSFGVTYLPVQFSCPRIYSYYTPLVGRMGQLP